MRVYHRAFHHYCRCFVVACRSHRLHNSKNNGHFACHSNFHSAEWSDIIPVWFGTKRAYIQLICAQKKQKEKRNPSWSLTILAIHDDATLPQDSQFVDKRRKLRIWIHALAQQPVSRSRYSQMSTAPHPRTTTFTRNAQNALIMFRYFLCFHLHTVLYSETIIIIIIICTRYNGHIIIFPLWLLCVSECVLCVFDGGFEWECQKPTPNHV